VSNTLVTCSIVAKESLAILKNMLSFSAAVNRDFESEFTSNMSRGYAPGSTINIKRPPALHLPRRSCRSAAKHC